MERPTWPGPGNPPSSEDARTRAGSMHGAGPPAGPPPGQSQSQDGRTRAGGSQTGAPGATRGGGRSSGPRAWVPGERVGPFVVKALLGQGGMGAVYTVTHGTTGVDYALKVLLAVDDAMGRARFEREGQAQASLPPHPNVVRVFGAGELEGVPYLLTELAPGGDLKGRLRQGPVPPLEACRLFVGLARALEHLHTRGVLHRDLKPHNVVFGADGAAKLMDFGLASLKGADKLTVTGSFMGTPNYMAPEQVDGQKVDARADVYGLGATLYQTLCGRPPFDGEQGVNMITKILTQPPRPLRSMQPDLPQDLVRVVERSMARDLQLRYPSAGAFAEDLEKLAAGQPLDPPPPTPGRRRKALLAGAIALLVVAAGAFVALRRPAATPVAPSPPSGTEPAVVVPSPAQPPPKPRGRAALLLVPHAQETVELPERAPDETVLRGGAPVDGPIRLSEGVNDLHVRRGASRTSWRVVRLPPGLSTDGEVAVNLADDSRLVFVPAAGKEPAFLLGEREVTWGQWRRYAEDADIAPPVSRTYTERYDDPKDKTRHWVEESVVATDDELPVVNVLFREVTLYCARVGLAVPTVEQWERAYGDITQRPWTPEQLAAHQRKVGAKVEPANARFLDTHQARVAPGASYPLDRAPCGAYDLYGNVQEWVAGEEIAMTSRGLGFGNGPSESLVISANDSTRQPYRGFRVACPLTRTAAAAPLPPSPARDRPQRGTPACLLVDPGVQRVPLPAWLLPGEELFRGAAAVRGPELTLDGGPVTRFEVRRDGRRRFDWDVVRLPPGARAVQAGRRALNEADGSGLVYVPASPEAGVTEPFLLGEREVTWGQYRALVHTFAAEGGRKATDGEPLEPPPTRLVNADGEAEEVPGLAEHPVGGLLPDEIDCYTLRTGLELPTKEEWLHARQGPERLAYPWGQEPGDPWPSNNLLDGRKPGPMPVGACPGDVSWCGALDLAGNADEWVRPGDAFGFICGGSWTDRVDTFARRAGGPGDVRERRLYHGFRVKCRLDRKAAPTPLRAP